jgi:23S rRNA pseudouridine1911/1915/1917 synthase
VTDRSLRGIPVLRENPYELVVVKPAGMPTELTSDPKGVSLISRLRSACPPPLEPKLPHRLDRVTRGVLLVALTPESIAFHGEQVRSGTWDKYYLARVYEPRDQDVAELLGRHRAYLKRVRHRAQIVHSGGKPSFLEILAAHPAPGRPGQAHLLIRLLTGRFHQVRVMLAGLGVPLVGDWVYGGDFPGGPSQRGLRRRGWDGFYLEHILLRYLDYEHRKQRIAHLRDDAHREPIDSDLRARIEAIADRS